MSLPAASSACPNHEDEACALRVDRLSHQFGARAALREVSFAVPVGQFTVLLGQNGAGKTTLFSLATRLYANRAGSIRVFGIDVRQRPSAALALIGAVFQQRTLDLDLTVAQNLQYHAALHGMARNEARRRMEEELDRLELRARAGDKVRQLSGGQMRRVEIARALLHRPRLLLLDEPTVGLDMGSRQAIVDHVRALARERPLGVLWATHLIDEVAPGDRAIVLHEGRVMADAPVPDLLRQTRAGDVATAFRVLTDGKPL